MTTPLPFQPPVRGNYKYVLTQGDQGWRLSVINGTPEEKTVENCISILREALAKLEALPTT